MPAYFPDRRTIIVVRAEYQAQANQIAMDATRAADGDATTNADTFRTPLQAAGQSPAVGPVVAYVANWSMTAAHRDAVLAEIGNRFKRAVEPIPTGAEPRAGEPFYIFDAEPGQWTDGAVFQALGMELVPNEI